MFDGLKSTIGRLGNKVADKTAMQQLFLIIQIFFFFNQYSPQG